MFNYRVSKLISQLCFRWVTDDDHQANLERLKHLPRVLKDIKILLEYGVEEGITHAKESIERSRLQFQVLQVRVITNYMPTYGSIYTLVFLALGGKP